MIPKHPAREVIIVFIKFPIAGQVKTRLAASLGVDHALRIYNELVALTFSVVSQWLHHRPEGGGSPSPRSAWIAFTPAELKAECRAWLADSIGTWPTPAEWVPQTEGDLGARLQNAFQEAFTSGFSSVCAIGGDCPGLTAASLEQAFLDLVDHDVVIGPASDGGYYLIGSNTHHPDLFDEIPWSTENTLRVTLNRARHAGLSVTLLPPLDDIDTEADWRRWMAVQDLASSSE